MRRSDWLTPALTLEKFSTSAASNASEAKRRTHNSVRQRLTSLHSKSTRGIDADTPCECPVIILTSSVDKAGSRMIRANIDVFM